jgi:hypothetical protein
VDIGDCKIKWSNGSAERNLSILTQEIDDIVAQNSAQKIGSIITTEENENEAKPYDSANKEK